MRRTLTVSPLIIDPLRKPICLRCDTFLLRFFSTIVGKKNVFFFVPGSPCEHDGICVNTPGSFACNCTQGFTGPRCETNVNECESHPCQNDGSCLDDPGTFRCVCMPGKWTLFSPLESNTRRVKMLLRTFGMVSTKRVRRRQENLYYINMEYDRVENFSFAFRYSRCRRDARSF